MMPNWSKGKKIYLSRFSRHLEIKRKQIAVLKFMRLNLTFKGFLSFTFLEDLHSKQTNDRHAGKQEILSYLPVNAGNIAYFSGIQPACPPNCRFFSNKILPAIEGQWANCGWKWSADLSVVMLPAEQQASQHWKWNYNNLRKWPVSPQSTWTVGLLMEAKEAKQNCLHRKAKRPVSPIENNFLC